MLTVTKTLQGIVNVVIASLLLTMFTPSVSEEKKKVISWKSIFLLVIFLKIIQVFFSEPLKTVLLMIGYSLYFYRFYHAKIWRSFVAGVSATVGAIAIQLLGLTAAFFVIRILGIRSQLIEELIILQAYQVFMLLLYWMVKKRRTEPAELIDRYLELILLCVCLILFVNYMMYMKHFQQIKSIVISVILIDLFSILAVVLSLKKEYLLQREMRRIVEDNKNLSKDAHRARELLPALKRLLDLSRENSPNRAEELAEVEKQTGKFYEEESRRKMEEMCLCSTKSPCLDSLMLHFFQECRDKGIRFELFVMTPIDYLLKGELKGAELTICRTFGDLLRNAVHILEKTESSCKIIEVDMGCRKRDGVYVFSVSDNGLPFAPAVLARLGERGNTTDGTGNGYADLFEMLEEYGASLIIQENPPSKDITKQISVIFDGRREIAIKSYRTKLLEQYSFREGNCIIKK